MIVINAMRFSGSNVFWNMIKSHPQISNYGNEYPVDKENILPNYCIKAMEEDIPNCCHAYPQATKIGLLRNPLCYLEAKQRRGVDSIQIIAEQYKKYETLIEEYSEKVFRYEDLLSDIIALSKKVNAFCGLDPICLENFRFKFKEGDFKGEKHWFHHSKVYDFIDSRRNEKQIEKLSQEDIEKYLFCLNKL